MRCTPASRTRRCSSAPSTYLRSMANISFISRSLCAWRTLNGCCGAGPTVFSSTPSRLARIGPVIPSSLRHGARGFGLLARRSTLSRRTLKGLVLGQEPAASCLRARARGVRIRDLASLTTGRRRPLGQWPSIAWAIKIPILKRTKAPARADCISPSPSLRAARAHALQN
jgi:hypothetical protein